MLVAVRRSYCAYHVKSCFSDYFYLTIFLFFNTARDENDTVAVPLWLLLESERFFPFFFSFSDLAEGTVTEGGRKEVDGAKRE